MKKRFTILALLWSAIGAYAQQAPEQTGRMYLDAVSEKWALEKADIADLALSDAYQTQHNGVTHLYFVQRYMGIPLHNAISGVHLDAQGRVAFATNRFEAHLAQRVAPSTPGLDAQAALAKALQDLGFALPADLEVKRQSLRAVLFAAPSIAEGDIEAKLVYTPVYQRQDIPLCWDFSINMRNSSDYWSIRVDAATGAVVERKNWTLYCSFDHVHGGNNTDDCQHAHGVNETANMLNNTLDGGASYRVFALPVESPIHGERTLVGDGANPAASPYGWHDVDGMEGSEYTITRGNNVHAFLDLEDTGASSGDEPDGTAELTFDFFFDNNAEPDAIREAAVTQLFYMNNMMHDITFAYGFDEAAGNFQTTNYTGEGEDGDYVNAQAQDGSGTNNANFATPPDGGRGQMQMYIWTVAGSRLMEVQEPSAISGRYETGSADYGPSPSTSPVEGFIAAAYDGTTDPQFACEAVVNEDEVAGKIALIDRGGCFFEQKTANAQAAGAIAVIICNFEENAPGMAGVADIVDPTIPTISLKLSDCRRIRNVLENGGEVFVRIAAPVQSGPAAVDGDFDNGIIAHEYGHGISNRLTGGPNQAGCLNNDEQMGEGWSDFFTLVTTVRPDDTGALPRGIGNYANRNTVEGGGIRRQQYSTDFTVNNQIYDDVIGSTAPHPLGEVWAATLWDLYWTMTEEYGYDEDLINGTGGNNMAIQLVIDGMKLQACQPGFIDGRDAILEADQLNYNGANECLIYRVFARRGFGFGASQGSSNDRNDHRMSFEELPKCVQELKIAKTSDVDLINAGEDVTFTLTVRNDKAETATAVVVEDALPEGMSYVPGSATGASAIDNGSSVRFELGEMQSGAQQTITYRVTTSPELASVSQMFDGMENGYDNWEIEVLEGSFFWDIVPQNPYEGNNAWFVENGAEENDQAIKLITPVPVVGQRPVLRFYHSYNTEAGLDGGIVQVSTNDGITWQNVADKFIRNAYRGALSYFAFTVPNLQGYWGNSGGYIDSYVDLSSYAGQNIQVRFRFGSDEAGFAQGWYMDNFELMDMFAYNSEAVVTSAEGDMATAMLAEGGVVVEPGAVGVDELAEGELEGIKVFPNPAHDLLQIALPEQLQGKLDVQLWNTNGQLMQQWAAQAGQLQTSLDLRQVPAGVYFLHIDHASGRATRKVTIF